MLCSWPSQLRSPSKVSIHTWQDSWKQSKEKWKNRRSSCYQAKGKHSKESKGIRLHYSWPTQHNRWTWMTIWVTDYLIVWEAKIYSRWTITMKSCKIQMISLMTHRMRIYWHQKNKHRHTTHSKASVGMKSNPVRAQRDKSPQTNFTLV